MLVRSYSEKHKMRRPSYLGCSVLDDWLSLSNFKHWMETQDYEGKQLDKDLLVPGNKVYSPEACVFVSRQVNMFLVDCRANRGKYLIGCFWYKRDAKFMALCSNPLTGKKDYLGMFSDEQEAHEAWLAKKLEHAKALAALQTDQRIAKALIDRYENYKIN
jgi:hypothetical protein